MTRTSRELKTPPLDRKTRRRVATARGKPPPPCPATFEEHPPASDRSLSSPEPTDNSTWPTPELRKPAPGARPEVCYSQMGETPTSRSGRGVTVRGTPHLLPDGHQIRFGRFQEGCNLFTVLCQRFFSPRWERIQLHQEELRRFLDLPVDHRPDAAEKHHEADVWNCCPAACCRITAGSFSGWCRTGHLLRAVNRQQSQSTRTVPQNSLRLEWRRPSGSSGSTWLRTEA